MFLFFLTFLVLKSGWMKLWKEQLAQAHGALVSLKPEVSWTDKKTLEATYADVLGKFDSDMAELKKQASFIFSPRKETDDLTEQNAALLKRWYLMGNMPSLPAMCVFAIDKLGLKPDADLLQMVFVAGILGSVENELPYHNVMHYKKVLLQALRLIAVHNDIYEDSDLSLDANDIAMLLIGACTHDLAHDGKGNVIKGQYEQARLEKRSITVLLPYFQAVGFRDRTLYERAIETFRILLLCTDTTPTGDPHSFMNQMKAAYRHHFIKTKHRGEKLNLDMDLKTLESDAKMTVMALLLHEADMANSSGLTYQITEFETGLFYREIEQEPARPSGILEFMNTICQRQVLSAAGQKLYSANMARIMSIAEKAIKAGDYPFVSPERSEFLRVHGGKDSGSSSRTIN